MAKHVRHSALLERACHFIECSDFIPNFEGLNWPAIDKRPRRKTFIHNDLCEVVRRILLKPPVQGLRAGNSHFPLVGARLELLHFDGGKVAGVLVILV
ncbi:hypothetical protein [Verrucomicrobium sp. BvORR106]|uniref:hypothetical protein n=1 Tax=Verrucomicrobium sp. BvORR106 TaxID=1403819 RepID=UPI00056EB1C6|nr:hypothetical protein [Verrucomicrobium sp. BvORR106]